MEEVFHEDAVFWKLIADPLFWFCVCLLLGGPGMWVYNITKYAKQQNSWNILEWDWHHARTGRKSESVDDKVSKADRDFRTLSTIISLFTFGRSKPSKPMDLDKWQRRRWNNRNGKKSCRSCGMVIPAKAGKCPYCQELTTYTSSPGDAWDERLD